MATLRSMTGFGRGRAERDGGSVSVEARSVNQKGLDVRVRVPRELASLEAATLEAVRTRLARGRVDVVIEVDQASGDRRRVTVDEQAAAGVLEQLAAFAAGRHDVVAAVTTGELLRVSSLVRVDEHPPELEAIEAAHEEALSIAVAQLLEARATEGAALEKALTQQLVACRELQAAIAARAADAPQRLAEKLRERLKDQDLGVVDPDRLAQEVALLAERADITEELDRLSAHLDHVASLMAADEPSGRRLDFLCQELNREANTIGSKAQDASLAHLVVDLKAAIERLREQVQNVE